MISRTAKPANSKAAKSQPPAASSGAALITGDSKPNSGSKASSAPAASAAPVTAAMRQAMISEAAYYIAQQRGFGEGRDVEDWLLAEKQIDAVLCA